MIDALRILLAVLAYAAGGAATRASTDDWTTDVAEGAAAFFWPLYWSAIAFGYAVWCLYLLLSGAWVVALLERAEGPT